MSLFLAQVQGTNSFRFATAQTHIISIARMDTGQGFAGTTTTIEGVVCTEVTYNRTLTGPTSIRLDALVHDTGFVTPQQIVVMAVPNGTMFNGTLVSAVAGVAVPIGGPGNPFTNHICTIYDADDCGGSGHWVDKEGGGTTSFPPDVILYHELAHCFHFATGVATSEPLAETDENDMRNARGLDRRNTASHNGGCGGGPTSCCVVATLATGSSYSSEIQRFRHFREHTLRQSIVGDDFFKELHFRYYRFSPEVTRLMGHQPNLSPVIKERFVLPLLTGIEMLIHYSEHDGRRLGGFLLAQARREGLSAIYEQQFLDQLSGYLRLARVINSRELSIIARAEGGQHSGFRKLLRHINRETIKDEYIDWALLSVVELWVSSARMIYVGMSESDLDREIYERIVHWIGKMPVSDVWKELSRLETEIELNQLERFIFDARSKEVFAARLAEKHSKHGDTIRSWAVAKRRDYDRA
jgi:hypothetical protein